MKAETAATSEWRLKRGELLLLALLGAAGVVVRNLIHDIELPWRMSGHSYFLYFLLLVFGRAYVGKSGGAAFMGMVAGVVAVLIIPKQGIGVFFRFFVPAAVLEAIARLRTLRHPVINRMLEGLVAAETMMIAKSINNYLRGKQTAEVVLDKLPYGSLTYIVMGVLMGIAAHCLMRALQSPRRT